MKNKSLNSDEVEIKNILENVDFQKKLARIAIQKGESLVQVNTEAQLYLKELYAYHNPTANVAFMELAQYLLGQGYDKNIDFNPLEIKELSKLMRQYPVAFVLTHKSYIDLLVLALVLARHGLPLPFMFAGINLDLKVAGFIARKNGVIYIRRSFKDNPVYKASLRHFTTYLLNKQSNFMWALEGTRSRTGKLIWPQMGILKYIMEADIDAKVKVKYVPVSIVYDLIPDVAEMTEEGRGKKKNPENLKWLYNYWKSMGKDKLGKISLRIGQPVELPEEQSSLIPDIEENPSESNSALSGLAFGLVHKINQITPITTVSLICNSLLSKFALSKKGLESDIVELMSLIESHKQDALVDRGRPIGESVQAALNLLTTSKIFTITGEEGNVKYTIQRENYLQATYYANMAVHHLYHRAFIELALAKIIDLPIKERMLAFWTEIMAMRDLFKFEFFYSKKAQFTDEIEADLNFLVPNWQAYIFESNSNINDILANQKLLVSPVLLFNYIESYRVVAQGLLTWDVNLPLEDDKFVEFCLFLGEEMNWQGRIRRIEAVSKPFLINGLRLVRNLKLIPTLENNKQIEIQNFIIQIENVADRINEIQRVTMSKPFDSNLTIPIERAIVPGSQTESIASEILSGERGSHIGAFFDLDRTLIKDFSAKEFFKARLLSGKFTSKELVAQFAGALSFATGNGNFASLAAISAKGIKGVKEQVFIDVGEEVYQKHLADSIFPASRALVDAHLSMGHTVAIVSAATPYQVNPIARDLSIEHVMCSRMEVVNGTFTGNIIEPTCWGEGKAIAGRELAQNFKLDLQKSFFYTDSAEDLPLLEIVGNPRPINADARLSSVAFQNDWPVLRFTEDTNSKLSNLIRTGAASGVFIPAILNGILKGVTNLSWTQGTESMMATVGDIGTAVAGIKLAVKGQEHLESTRPAVFIINHQSYADFLIGAKLIRKNVTGVAKKELQNTPILGQMFSAAGVIFVDRADKDKAIEAMAPAVDGLKNGISIAIFPEGTRSYDYTLGKFKKGAFHLAMAAGVPLIPIIMKNAHDAMPRGTNIFKPTLVEVVVLPPIHTTEWTPQNMNVKINEVRNLFLKELGQPEE
jgi:putative phosphoserine phosphatase/1-acylglycerol-3-phosphate O-acyltransferase